MSLREQVEVEMDRQRNMAAESRDENRRAATSSERNAYALATVIHEATADALETMLLVEEGE